MKSKRFNLAVAREAFTYDPTTGIVYWNPDRPRSHFPTESGYRRWEGKNAGRPAGSPNRDGYLYANFTFPDGTRTAIAIHRVAWMLANQREVPPGMQIDHWGGDRQDNRVTNLRLVGPALNSKNTVRRKRPSTGYSGIYETSSGYQVWLTVETGQSPKLLGHCRTLEEAIELRKNEALPRGYTLRHLGLKDDQEAA